MSYETTYCGPCGWWHSGPPCEAPSDPTPETEEES